MKLYSTSLSPYATRIRIQIRLKDLPIEISEPPVPLRTPEFKEMFTLGKVPVLKLEDGNHLPDSWVIMEYLEDTFPENTLRPSHTNDRAQMNLLARYADTYLAQVLFPVFQALTNMPDEQVQKMLMENLKKELSKLDRLLGEQTNLDERDVHLGDIALATNLFFVDARAPLFGETEILVGFDHIDKWWSYVNSNEFIKQGLDEMTTALKTMTG